jgi:folate-binding protein YgfZ
VVILEGGSVAKGSWSNEARIEADISLPGVRRTFVSSPPPDLEEAPPELAEGLRIAAGEPLMGVDVDESTIPQESGLVESAVALDKGCFLGQELVARIDSRGGRVPRLLRGLRLVPGVGAGDELRREDRVVGKVSSTGEHPLLGPVGLALVRREVEPGASVSAAAGEVRVELLPMTGYTPRP